jgi:hypothetical protein
MEIKFFRREGYILFDHEGNEESLEELKVKQLTRNIRLPKVILNYRPNGGRRLGRPLKKLLEEAEAGILSLNRYG